MSGAMSAMLFFSHPCVLKATHAASAVHAASSSASEHCEDKADAPFAPIITAWLQQVGEIYMPFLLANAAAIEAGEDSFHITAMALPYTQGVFKYQVKCLADLRARYTALDAHARARIDPLLAQTGCLEALRNQ